ncbi:MAG: glycosyltransferase family 39 protein [Prolixibacteraceae bacterium]
MNKKQQQSYLGKYWILLLLVALKLVLQFMLVNPVYELHRDEFLHLDQAFHPAAGYISVPPFTSWTASIIYLLGGGIFWIRFFPAFFGALTIVFAWLTAEELGGKLPAKILTSVLLIFSVLARLNILFQPNSFDILAWTIVFYLLIRYVNSLQSKWLLILSVILALGFYNKYNIIFLIAGLFAAFLMTSHRTIFIKREFYLALAFCLILISPNIFWQIQNNFPVILHMKALNSSQLVNVNRADFLIDQLKFGLIGIPALAAFWAIIFYKPFKSLRFIGWTFMVVIGLYTLAHAKNYYALGLYPVLIPIGSVYLEIVARRWRFILFPLIAALSIAAFLLVAKYLMPFQSPEEIVANRATYENIGLLRWEDGKNHPLPQDFADMISWKEMADKSLAAWQMIPENELKNTLIFCDNYGQTGALNFYNRGKMPQAYSFNTDYAFWLPEIKQIRNVIKVGDVPEKEVSEMFTEVRLIGEVENEFAREKGTKIYLLTGANAHFTEWFNKLAAERKASFRIF